MIPLGTDFGYNKANRVKKERNRAGGNGKQHKPTGDGKRDKRFAPIASADDAGMRSALVQFAAVVRGHAARNKNAKQGQNGV